MEWLDICDENGLPTGQTVSRETAHQQGIRHRTAHVWVIRRREGRVDILLQQRSAQKDSFPGQWDTSSAGHIPAGDEPAVSAVRELSEELGIHASPQSLRYAGYFDIRYEKVFHNAWFRDDERAYVYLYEEPVDLRTLTLQPEEVSAVDWFDFEATLAACRRHDPQFCVPVAGLEVLGKALQLIPETKKAD